MKYCSNLPGPFRRSGASSWSDGLRDLCIRYNEVMLIQARITAACNALHPIEERFCRWLLQSSDRAASDTVTLTQELLSEMLGVRRTSVTEVARKLQDKGVITYARGVILILDRARWNGSPASVTGRLSSRKQRSVMSAMGRWRKPVCDRRRHPLYPRKRTSRRHGAMSEKCHKQTIATKICGLVSGGNCLRIPTNPSFRPLEEDVKRCAGKEPGSGKPQFAVG